jgi:hypothetical protein
MESNKGLLEDSEIEGIMSTIMERGGRVKNFMIHLGTRFLIIKSTQHFLVP